ncbi:MAG: ABC transporter permease [Rivihabitans pingtungensis]
MQAALGRQLQQCGLRALPGIACLGAALGLAAVQQMHHVYSQCGLHPAHLAAIIAVQNGPAVDRAVFCLRSSSGIAAEVAALRVHGEWRTLAAMQVDPLAFVLLPRLGHPLASALLTLYLLLIAQGAAAVLYALDAPDQATFYSMLEPLTPAMALLCLSKSLLFGALTAASSAGRLPAEGDWPAVSQASARAVLFGLLAIVAADALFALLPALWSPA